MALEIKTLRTGQLKISSAGFCPGERVLYLTPNTAEPFGATVKKAALVTGMRFYNTNPGSSGAVTINIYFARYDSSKALKDRPPRRILPIDLSLASGQSVFDNIPLTLEEGDAILGDASQANVIDYIISGVERDVS